MDDNIENIEDIEDITDDQTLAEIDLFWGMFKDSEEMSFTFFNSQYKVDLQMQLMRMIKTRLNFLDYDEENETN
tara:strand:+ start:358 stop:579 length:222 start_codon:yes stop_codon:yes gene_type:complete